MEYEPPKNMPDDEQKLWMMVTLIKKAIASQSRGKCSIFIWDLIPKGVELQRISMTQKLSDGKKNKPKY